MTFQSCSANCVVKHGHESSCQFRHMQCPFVTCSEKIPVCSLVDHLWATHKLLQFPTENYCGSFNFGDKTFGQNFAARPFCMTFEDKQFVLEICRKHDTGLWHFWMFIVGSPWESNFYTCQIKIVGKKEREEILYKGPVISMDVPFSDIFKKCESLVVPDDVLKRFCNHDTMSVAYQIDLRLVEYNNYEDLCDYARETAANSQRQWSPTESGDSFQANGTNSVPINGSNPVPINETKSSPINGTNSIPSARKPEIRVVQTFANAPKIVGPGVVNKFGKVIYPDSHKLFVGNLFKECKEDLVRLFTPYGEIADVLFFKNAIPVKKFPFYAFVVFKEEKSVNLVCMNKPIYFPDGQQLIVQNKVDSPCTTYFRQSSTESENDVTKNAVTKAKKK